MKLIANYGDFNENGIIDDEERNEALEWKTEFRYDTANKKVYTKNTEYEEKTGTEDIKTGELTLNADGYAIEAKYETNNDGCVETYQISYQDEYAVAIKAIELNDDSPYPYVEEPEWEAGNLVKVLSKRGSSLFGYSDVTYGNELNRSDVSLDLNFVIANTEWYGCFCEDGNYGLKVCGLFGKRSKNMMIKEKEIDCSSSDLPRSVPILTPMKTTQKDLSPKSLLITIMAVLKVILTAFTLSTTRNRLRPLSLFKTLLVKVAFFLCFSGGWLLHTLKEKGISKFYTPKYSITGFYKMALYVWLTDTVLSPYGPIPVIQ